VVLSFLFNRVLQVFGKEIQQLIFTLSKLPGLGPRSGRRLAFHLLKKKEVALSPLIRTLQQALEVVDTCQECGNLDTAKICSICSSSKRDNEILCIVEDVADLWALERSGEYRGKYFILGGKLSAINGVKPEDLRIPFLLQKIQKDGITEVILALSPTLEGQTTLYYIREYLSALNVKITGLAHGLPMGGDLDYLDDATLTTAMIRRQAV